jgi:hypothetical protein
MTDPLLEPLPMREVLRRRPRRRLHWCLRAIRTIVLLAILLIVALYFTGEQIAQRILAEKLQELVSQQLNARLAIGKLKYQFPYTVSVNDVSLVTAAPEGGDLTLMSFNTLSIKLAQFPLKRGPLVVERIDFDHPTVHLIETKSGFIGETSLIRSDDDKKKDTTNPPPLSDVLQLRHVAFTAMRAEYEDRTVAGSKPLVWENLDASFDSTPTGKASHHFSFTADNGDLAQIDAGGTLDLDSLILAFERLQVTTQIKARQANAALPAAVQKVLVESGIAGKAVITVTGSIPLMHTRDIDAHATIKIENGQGIVPGYAEPVEDLTLIGSGEYQHRVVKGKVERFEFRTASIGVSVQPCSGVFDRNSGRWLVDPVKAAVAYQPVDSMKRFWRQKLALDLRAGVHQLDQKNRVEVVFDGTTLTPQGLADSITANGTILFGPQGVNLNPSTMTGLGGTIQIVGMANISNKAYSAKVAVHDVEMNRVMAVIDPITTKETYGRLSGEVRATMVGGRDTLSGEGGFRITDGQFAKVPVLSPIADFLHIGQGAVTANDAFGHFKIEPAGLGFDRIAISTSLLRIRGQGSIGFDQNLDLKVYADSASNWGATVRKTGIPIFSNLIGAVAGGTQSVLGTVSKQFTSLSVTGTIDQPKIRPAPAPLLTDNLQKLFRAVE